MAVLPIRLAFFGTKPYDRRSFEGPAREAGVQITHLEPRLTVQTVSLSEEHDAACVFVNDEVPREVLVGLHARGVRIVALRCAGFNNVDLKAAQDLGITVARVPAYSAFAVAEHTVGLILSLNRKIHRAYDRVRDGNFALEGLLGFDLNGKTVGVIGTGRIGAIVSRILQGFGCEILAHDLQENPDCLAAGGRYVTLEEIYRESDIISLHCPLAPETHHLINEAALRSMKRGVMLINTSRGALLDARAAVVSLKSGQLGSLGLDVYEEEADLFFEDLSDSLIQDDVFSRLLTFPNVLITGHQAFFTQEALEAIAVTTVKNLRSFFDSGTCENAVTNRHVAPR